jgi:hypothetical protein
MNPANVFKAIGERSPLAPLSAKYRAAIAQGGGAADLARTKMALGTAVMLTSLDMALSGQITGSGPSKPGERQNWERRGNKPYSIMIDGRPVGFSRVDPAGSLLAYGADLAEYLLNSDEGIDLEDDTAFERAWGAAVLSAAEVVSNRTALQGFADTVDAMSNPQASGVSYLKRFAGSLIVPRGLTEAARLIDPVQRDTANIVQELKSRLPWWSESLPPSRDTWGRVRSWRSDLGGIYDAVSPLYLGQDVTPEPIDLEMQKDGWYLGMPGKAFIIQSAKVPLSRRPDIYSRFLELRGTVKLSDLAKLGPMNGEAVLEQYPELKEKTLLEALNGIVQGEGELGRQYKAIPDADHREKFVRKVAGRYQDVAKEAIFKQYPEILQGAMDLIQRRNDAADDQEQ